MFYWSSLVWGYMPQPWHTWDSLLCVQTTVRCKSCWRWPCKVRENTCIINYIGHVSAQFKSNFFKEPQNIAFLWRICYSPGPQRGWGATDTPTPKCINLYRLSPYAHKHLWSDPASPLLAKISWCIPVYRYMRLVFKGQLCPTPQIKYEWNVMVAMLNDKRFSTETPVVLIYLCFSSFT